MYRPSHFREDDPAAVTAFLSAHPLATLVGATAAGPVAEHLPMTLVRTPDGAPILVGHVARANDVWRQLPDGAPVIAVFTGASAYVTPSWYAAKRTTGEVVPTWNYSVVHARGTVRFSHDPDTLRAIVGRLTDVFEAARPAPWRVDDAPVSYVDGMLRAIVGVEIAVERFEAKVKASQNRSADDRARVADGLLETGVPPEHLHEVVRPDRER
jgi:transcriptional regulator